MQRQLRTTPAKCAEADAREMSWSARPLRADHDPAVEMTRFHASVRTGDIPERDSFGEGRSNRVLPQQDQECIEVLPIPIRIKNSLEDEFFVIPPKILDGLALSPTEPARDAQSQKLERTRERRGLSLAWKQWLARKCFHVRFPVGSCAGLSPASLRMAATAVRSIST